MSGTARRKPPRKRPLRDSEEESKQKAAPKDYKPALIAASILVVLIVVSVLLLWLINTFTSDWGGNPYADPAESKTEKKEKKERGFLTEEEIQQTVEGLQYPGYAEVLGKRQKFDSVKGFYDYMGRERNQTIEQLYGSQGNYWNQDKADEAVVLDGWVQVDKPDIADSRKHLEKVLGEELAAQLKAGKKRWTCIDTSAGMGRVVQQLLVDYCHETDIVEPAKKLIDAAMGNLTAMDDNGTLSHGNHVGKPYNMPLQDFRPPKGRKYDLVWGQWVVMFLNDADVIASLQRLRKAMKPTSLLFVKENLSTGGFQGQPQWLSVSRTRAHLEQLFELSGFEILVNTKMEDLPSNLLDIAVFVLKPKA